MPYQGLRMYHKVDKSSNIEAKKQTNKKNAACHKTLLKEKQHSAV